MHKFSGSHHFQSALRGYGLFPERALIFWWVVPIFELAGALEILVSVGESRLLAFLILGLYATLIFYNLIIGRVNLDCGCGGAGNQVKLVDVWSQCGTVTCLYPNLGRGS